MTRGVQGIDSSSTPVKILIDISPEHYDRLLSRFTEESRIYAILKNGLEISCTNDSRCC
jgi:hypothetical protein